MTGLQEYFPDPRRGATGDMLTRNLYFRSNLHMSVVYSAPYTTTLTTDEPLRIRSVQVASDPTATLTIQIKIDGRDIFDDASRPFSAGPVAHPTSIYNIPASSAIDAIIEAVSGAPAADAEVEIEVEPYILAPRSPQIPLHGTDRKRPSIRGRIEEFNARGSLVPAIVTHRVVGTPSPRVLPIGEPLGYRPREVTP